MHAFDCQMNEARRADPAPPLVAVIDDDDGARLSTGWFLEGEGYRVRLFGSGDEFLCAPLSERPDAILLDLRMPGTCGLDVLRALGDWPDAPPVLVVSGQANLRSAVDAMKLNAVDVILKPYKPTALLGALARAAAERVDRRAQHAAGDEARIVVEALPARQREVLSGIVRGLANKAIAWELGLSVRTIESYRAQLFARLGVRTTAEAVRIAMAAGLHRLG